MVCELKQRGRKNEAYMETMLNISLKLSRFCKKSWGYFIKVKSLSAYFRYLGMLEIWNPETTCGTCKVAPKAG